MFQNLLQQGEVIFALDTYEININIYSSWLHKTFSKHDINIEGKTCSWIMIFRRLRVFGGNEI